VLEFQSINLTETIGRRSASRACISDVTIKAVPNKTLRTIAVEFDTRIRVNKNWSKVRIDDPKRESSRNVTRLAVKCIYGLKSLIGVTSARAQTAYASIATLTSIKHSITAVYESKLVSFV
jgi:hypothetical protein